MAYAHQVSHTHKLDAIDKQKIIFWNGLHKPIPYDYTQSDNDSLWVDLPNSTLNLIFPQSNNYPRIDFPKLILISDCPQSDNYPLNWFSQINSNIWWTIR